MNFYSFLLGCNLKSIRNLFRPKSYLPQNDYYYYFYKRIIFHPLHKKVLFTNILYFIKKILIFSDNITVNETLFDRTDRLYVNAK